MRDLFRLIDAICEAIDNQDWWPHDDENGVETHCNLAVNYVCAKMGYKGFGTNNWVMLANDMVKKMKADTAEWMAIDPDMAQEYANMGSLVVAGQWRKGHGHVCVVRPGCAAASAKWNMNAPKVLNMGRDVFISKSLSWAFKDRPDTWVWTGSL